MRINDTLDQIMRNLRDPGEEVHALARQHMQVHATGYVDALHAVLRGDPKLVERYAFRGASVTEEHNSAGKRLSEMALEIQNQSPMPFTHAFLRACERAPKLKVAYHQESMNGKASTTD